MMFLVKRDIFLPEQQAVVRVKGSVAKPQRGSGWWFGVSLLHLIS